MSNIVIAGMGLNGIILYHSLLYKAKLAGIDIADKISVIAPYYSKKGTDNRTTAVSYGSYKILQAMGIDISQDSGYIEKIKIFDNDISDCANQVNFDNEQIMGYVIRNSDLYNLLYKDIDIIQGEIKDIASNYIIYNDDQIMKYDLLLASDGAQSSCAKLLGLTYKESDYKQTAITFNISHSNNHNNTAIERFTPTGPFAMLPLDSNKSGQKTSIIWSVNSNIISSFLKLSKEQLLTQARQLIDNSYQDVEICSEICSFPLKLSYLQNLAYGKVIFIGDSAHKMHPVAGQGLNLSVRDIDCISNIIVENISLGLNPAFNIKRINKLRHKDIRTLLYSTEAITRLFSNDNILLQKIRRLSLGYFNKMTIAKNIMINYAMGKDSVI